MKRIDDFLNTEEQINIKTNPYFLKIFLCSKNTTIGLFLTLVFITLNVTLNLNFIFLIIPFALLLISCIKSYIETLLTNYYITNQKIIIETGWIGKDYDIVKLDRVLDVNIDVSVLDTLFNTGSIKLCTANDSEPICLHNIKNPKTIIKSIKF